MFNLVLDNVLTDIDWTRTGVGTDGEHLDHFKFADDSIPMINITPNLQD